MQYSKKNQRNKIHIPYNSFSIRTYLRTFNFVIVSYCKSKIFVDVINTYLQNFYKKYILKALIAVFNIFLHA